MPSEFASETALFQSDVRALRGALMLACEDADQSGKSSTDTLAAYQPRNPSEGDLEEQMFSGAWRIRRIKMIETSLINHEMTLPDIHVAEAFRALVSRPVPHTIP